MHDGDTAPFALVVEDEPLILMDACDILEQAGFRFIEAHNGEIAKDLLEETAEAITLLFTDVDMPGSTNGFALARYVSEHWPHITIVVASGRVKAGPGDLPDGATFIPKPFSAEIVHAHLAVVLPDGRKPEPLR